MPNRPSPVGHDRGRGKSGGDEPVGAGRAGTLTADRGPRPSRKEQEPMSQPHHDDNHQHHPHDQGAEHHGEHDHEHGSGLLGRLKELVTPHSHDAAVAVDSQLETSRKGIRALAVSFAGLAVTAVLQAVVVWRSHSVALLGDTLHNLADALTAVPLGVAFTLGRRAATRRYTYGYGRAEDLAGVVIVGFIAASSALAGYQAVRRLLDPVEVRALGLVAAAAVIGFAGNELGARYRIRVGHQIGSAALVADGLHARTDGLTSLSVLLGAAGVALGFPLADPLVGLGITAAILVVLRDAAREVYRRLMDAVDPELVDRVEAELAAAPGVLGLGRSGCAGSATLCGPSARSWSTPSCRWWRGTGSPRRPSIGSSTTSRGSPPRWSMPIPWNAEASTTMSSAATI